MLHNTTLVIPIGERPGRKQTVPAAEEDDGAGDPSLDPESPVATGSPRPGSSCYALRAAVANLTFWDDFAAEKIGSGFFSDVYKIRHLGNGNVMVVKISKSRNNRLNQHMMLQELELLNQLDHPNVVRYMGACVKDGHIHPLLEFISGGPLEDVLRDRTMPLSWQQKTNLATDIARGMEYLHSKNVCHRDLKAENCLVRKLPDDKLEAVVSDFGLARVLTFDKDDDESHQESPRKMSLVGSPFWMAPEILRGEEYTKTVDVFSFGIILCEIIARITADPEDLPRTNLFGLDVDGFRKMCPDCPENMLQLAAECCSMDPTKRPSFITIYHRLCFISHHISTSGQLSTTHITDMTLPMTKQNGVTLEATLNNNRQVENEGKVNGSSSKNKQETCPALETHEDNAELSTAQESILATQNLSPIINTSKKSLVLRTLYILSGVSVLLTLTILNFWKSNYTLMLVLVPLTWFVLYHVAIKNWCGQNQLTLKLSEFLHGLGRRLIWRSSTSSPCTSRSIGEIELESKQLNDNKMHHSSEWLPDEQDEDHVMGMIHTIDSKHDTYANSMSSNPEGVLKPSSIEVSFNSKRKVLPVLPVVRCKRRTSRPLLKDGSFHVRDSIEEHVDESCA